MSSVISSEGFTVHARGGELLAYVEHFECALAAMKRNPAAQSIRRVADEELLATKCRPWSKGAPVEGEAAS